MCGLELIGVSMELTSEVAFPTRRVSKLKSNEGPLLVNAYLKGN